MIRHLKVVCDTTIKARTQAMQTLKAIIICSRMSCASNSTNSAAR